jgi:poly(beta-D-mannuronate) lyase
MRRAAVIAAVAGTVAAAGGPAVADDARTGVHDAVYSGVAACADVGASPGFRRAFAVVVRGGRAVSERGVPGAEGWERLEIRIAPDGGASASGTYVAGTAKPIAYAGRAEGGRLVLEGDRGPRVCRIEAAAPARTAAPSPLRAVPDPAERRSAAGRPGPSAACADPVPPVRDLPFQPFYRRDDPTHSIVDPEAVERYRADTRPVDAFEDAVARLGDAYLRTVPRSPALAECLARWLDAWASAGALAGAATPQGGYVRKWALAVAALQYAVLADAPEVGADRRRRIEGWLRDVGDLVALSYAAATGTSGRNNHLNWAVLAAMAAAAASDDRVLFDWAADRADAALAEIAPDGSLPLELARASLAGHYHRFALEPLVVAAEIAAANGLDLAAARGGALHRLARFVHAAQRDPAPLSRLAGVEQAGMGAGAVRPWMLAWAEPYAARHPASADLLADLAAARASPLYRRQLGGDMTLRFGPARRD